jgi:hypothetical protein
MKALQWLKHEMKEMIVLFIYFAFYFGIFIVLKKLILAHYQISFFGFDAVMLGALLAAKAVLVIESLPLPKFLRSAAPYLKVIYETILYTLLALVFLYLEKSLELMHKEGSFRLAFFTATREDDIYEFCATVGWASLCFLNFAIFSAINGHLSPKKLWHVFFAKPLP